MEAINPFLRFLEIRQYCAEPAEDSLRAAKSTVSIIGLGKMAMFKLDTKTIFLWS